MPSYQVLQQGLPKSRVGVPPPLVPHHAMMSGWDLFSYFSLFLLFFFLISIMHIGSHSVIPVIWFSAVCVFLLFFKLIIYPCMAFQEPGGVSFPLEDTFCMSSIILQSSLVLFFFVWSAHAMPVLLMLGRKPTAFPYYMV